MKDGLRNAASHHVDSFNYAFEKCLPLICKYMLPVETTTTDDTLPFKKFAMWFESFELQKPCRPAAIDLSGNNVQQDDTMLPSECRIRGMNYSAPLVATVCRKVDNEPEERISVPLGNIPVMVRSRFCNLAGMSEDNLVRSGEDMHEFGGYFIINGNEKIVRMLVVNKRNYPVCFSRPNFQNRGRLFSSHAV